VPAVAGRYWVMPVGRLNMLIVLDVANPARPVEVSRLETGSTFRPHWASKDPGSDRIIVGAQEIGEERMLMVRLDTLTGKLSWDAALRGRDGQLGLSFAREQWPHGATGHAFGHAALFRP
jgi:hypothetical protein